MIDPLGIYGLGAIVAAIICAFENYKQTGKISIKRIDTSVILLSWVSVILWFFLKIK